MDDPCDPWFEPDRFASTPPIKKDPQFDIGNWLPIAALVLTAIWILISRHYNLPHPLVGTFIGILAFGAAVVTLWPPTNPLAKAAWFVAFGAFLVLEISTLYKQHADDLETDRNKTREENVRFEAILTQNQNAFDATMRKMQGLADLSTENLNTATGGSG